MKQKVRRWIVLWGEEQTVITERLTLDEAIREMMFISWGDCEGANYCSYGLRNLESGMVLSYMDAMLVWTGEVFLHDAGN